MLAIPANVSCIYDLVAEVSNKSSKTSVLKRIDTVRSAYKINRVIQKDMSLIGLDKQKISSLIFENIFLSINLNMCFGCSKEPSH